MKGVGRLVNHGSSVNVTWNVERARGGEDDDRDAELRDVLLEAHVAVAGDEVIELLFGEREQAAVFDVSPAHPLH